MSGSHRVDQEPTPAWHARRTTRRSLGLLAALSALAPESSAVANFGDAKQWFALEAATGLLVVPGPWLGEFWVDAKAFRLTRPGGWSSHLDGGDSLVTLTLRPRPVTEAAKALATPLQLKLTYATADGETRLLSHHTLEATVARGAAVGAALHLGLEDILGERGMQYYELIAPYLFEYLPSALLSLTDATQTTRTSLSLLLRRFIASGGQRVAPDTILELWQHVQRQTHSLGQTELTADAVFQPIPREQLPNAVIAPNPRAASLLAEAAACMAQPETSATTAAHNRPRGGSRLAPKRWIRLGR